mmetsp:Transcript_141894/g.441136  ORF Transcript_141894/g.441136 Transcript_141894/m.441136 type:complete len:330 (+) Transcript_141894:2386-3375(+)
MQSLVADLQNVALRRVHDAGLLLAEPEELVIEPHHDLVAHAPCMIHVQRGGVQLRAVVEVDVKAAGRDLDGPVGSRKPHQAPLVGTFDAPRVTERERHDHRTLALVQVRQGHDPRVLRVCNKWRGHIPGLQEKVFAPGLVRVGHNLRQDHQELVLCYRQLDIAHVRAQICVGVKPNVPTSVLHHIHDLQLPALQEVDVPVHLAARVVVVVLQPSGSEQGLLRRPAEGHPDHAAAASPDPEAEQGLQRGGDEQTQICQSSVTPRQGVLRFPVQGVVRKVGILGAVVVAQVGHLQLLCGQTPVVKVSRLLRRGLPYLRRCEHLNQAIALLC